MRLLVCCLTLSGFAAAIATRERVQKLCPSEVARCDANPACSRALADALQPDKATEKPPNVLAEVVACYRRKIPFESEGSEEVASVKEKAADRWEKNAAVAKEVSCDACSRISEDLFSMAAHLRMEGQPYGAIEDRVDEWLEAVRDPESQEATMLRGLYDIKDCRRDGKDDDACVGTGRRFVMVRTPPWDPDDEPESFTATYSNSKAAASRHHDAVNKRGTDADRVWHRGIYKILWEGPVMQAMDDELAQGVVRALKVADRKRQTPDERSSAKKKMAFITRRQENVAEPVCRRFCAGGSGGLDEDFEL